FHAIKMRVFKFGGASVNTARGVRNVALILQSHADKPVLIVVSAMGKTTNALEQLLNEYRNGGQYSTQLATVKHFHAHIMEDLFPTGHTVFNRVAKLFEELESRLSNTHDYDEAYDQVVCYGELISTVIIHHYLTD